MIGPKTVILPGTYWGAFGIGGVPFACLLAPMFCTFLQAARCLSPDRYTRVMPWWSAERG